MLKRIYSNGGKFCEMRKENGRSDDINVIRMYHEDMRMSLSSLLDMRFGCSSHASELLLDGFIECCERCSSCCCPGKKQKQNKKHK